jgi:hypothetical protein
MNKELEKLELRKSNLQNDLMDRVITSQVYQDIIGRLDKDIALTREKLTELQQEVSPFKKYIQKEVPMMENLLEYYRKSDGATKKKILGTIFAEKLILENGKITAPTCTESIKLMFRIGKSIGNSKGNKEVDIDLTFLRPNQI